MLKYYNDIKKDTCLKCVDFALVIPQDCYKHYLCMNCYKEVCPICKTPINKVSKEKVSYIYNYGNA